MKSAICFSGQLRTFFECFGQVKKTIIDPNNCDVFIHTWEHEDAETAIQVAQPKKYLVQHQIQFDEKDYNERKTNVKVFNTLSASYSMWKANMLRCEYQLENKIVYDCVVRCRMDLYPMNQLNLQDYDMTKLNIPDMWQKFSLYGSIEDQFAFSSSFNMNYFSCFYLAIDAVWRDTLIPFNSEDLLTAYILGQKEFKKEKKIEKYGEKLMDINIIEFPYRLIR